MRNNLFAFTITALLIIGCGGKKNSPQPNPGTAPAKAVLVYPSNNEACTEGTVISATQSSVVFKWNTAANAESYDLVLKNLSSGTSTTHTTTNTESAVTLARNTPYSWSIVSKSGKTSATTQSDTWKFYNSGPGVVSYAPFPAEVVSPTMGQAITATGGKVSLDWNGSDADNDIKNYDVYFGTTATPAIKIKVDFTETILNDVPVSSNTTYYWKIVTKDNQGNTSESEVFQFKVN